ncbi:hypothetical protein [Spirillospora sp. NPDC047279]|uniref:hypothetical protein n=1 Tax=Spirillospora sp. NPDC047279 TaxID=3155478 RepID=UPI0033E59082
MRAIAAAAHAGGEYAADAAPISRGLNLQMTAVLAVVEALWTILGTRLRAGHARPAALPAAGALLVVHLFVLWLAWTLQPLGDDAFIDDQSGLLEHRPSWHAPSLALVLVPAAVAPFAALLGLATAVNRPEPRPGRGPGRRAGRAGTR